MAYEVIIVDAFNLFYRVKHELDKTPIEKALRTIKFIEDDIRPKISKSGRLYLLFDPLPKKDYGYSDKFVYTKSRNEINPYYKQNRKHDPDIQEALRLVRDYYKYRGKNIITVYASELEADDFVEGIVEKETCNKIAMYSSDMDWARYLAPNVVLINKSFSEPYTDKKFIEEFGYNPTPTSVAIYKAFYGDPSDNIIGVKNIPKLKFLSIYDIDNLVKEVILQYQNEKLSKFVNDLKETNSVKLFEKVDKTSFEKFIMALESAIGGKVIPKNAMLDNLRVIKSRCSDVNKYCYSYEYSEKACSLIEKVLGMTKKQKVFKFGGVSIK